METVLTSSPEAAARFIIDGGLCAFPTETVYGLGANIFDKDALAKIFAAKGRPSDNPLIAHIATRGQIAELASVVTPAAERLIEAFFPGPLTVVLPRSSRVPLRATAGLETIGIRMPKTSTAREFLTACGVPVAAPSANISGRPSPTTWQAVLEDLGGRIDCVLQGDATEIGLESTVVDCSGDVPVLLRPGAISIDELLRVVPNLTEAVHESAGQTLPSPGLRHRHYTPRATVVLVEGVPERIAAVSDAYIGTDADAARHFSFSRVCRSSEEYAAALFEFLRECDRRGISTIFCGVVDEKGIGRALMDRLRRAAL